MELVKFIVIISHVHMPRHSLRGMRRGQFLKTALRENACAGRLDLDTFRARSNLALGKSAAAFRRLRAGVTHSQASDSQFRPPASGQQASIWNSSLRRFRTLGSPDWAKVFEHLRQCYATSTVTGIRSCA
ncbi:hypothetical protein [Pandoraea thiooxydans]|uniref:hypothetical protein n=1 Tax=Pandoraea thiooxydans TaxID=445709 RepID=UPI0012ECADEC|nr:hypothetical protein [Pandoraea thiooxydans]